MDHILILLLGQATKATINAIVKKVGTSLNFFLAFHDELEKQLFIKKTVEAGQ